MKLVMCHNCLFCVSTYLHRLATGWTVRGSNPGGGEIFRTCPDRPWGPASLLYNGYRFFPGGKERPGRDADPSPLLMPWSWKGRAIPLLSLWAVRPVQSLSGCTRVHFTLLQCLYKGALYLAQCLYKVALYLTSVPVQGCTLPFFLWLKDKISEDIREQLRKEHVIRDEIRDDQS